MATAASYIAAFPDGLAAPPEVRRQRRQQVRSSLRASVKDGVAWSVMQGAGERYVTPFVILGGSGLLPLAAIAALPLLAGSFVQWLAAEVADSCGRRKRMFVSAGLAQVALWAVFCIGICLPAGVQYPVMLVAYVLFAAGHHFSLPPWLSTMGDLVPGNRRGRYFGTRNFVCGLVMIAAFLGGGWWLTFCERHPSLALFGLSAQNVGFLTLFLIAGVARAVSVGYLRQMIELPYRPLREQRFSLAQFVRAMPRSPFGRFVLYRAGMQAGLILITPYLAWYLLDQLGSSPFVFAAVMTANFAAAFTGQLLCGRVADRIGAKRMLAIGGVGSVVVPGLLLFSNHPAYFAAVQLVDGLVLAAHSVGATNYMLDVVTPAKRARCAAFSTFFLGIGGAVGAFGGALLLLGSRSWLADGAPPLGAGWHPFHLLLLVAVLVRAIPNILLLPTFHEARLGQAEPPRLRRLVARG